MTSIFLDSDRIAGYSMDIDTDSFDIPNTEYHAHIIMPAAEFTQIVCDFLLLHNTLNWGEWKEMTR